MAYKPVPKIPAAVRRYMRRMGRNSRSQMTPAQRSDSARHAANVRHQRERENALPRRASPKPLDAQGIQINANAPGTQPGKVMP